MAAEEFSLASGRALGETSQIEVLLEVGGDLLVKDEKEKKAHQLKTSVVGTMVYDGRSAATPTPTSTRGVRQYRRCDAVIKIDKGSTKARLRDDRRLIAVAADNRDATLFCPTAPLSEEELDLIEIPACSLLVERLLPDRPVAPGDQWQHSEDLLICFLNLDAISQSDVTTTFKQATDDAAQLEVAGTVQGAVEGASTEIEIKGRYKYDLQAKRITWLALLVKEKRSIGNVSPGVDVTARLQMKIVPGTNNPALSDEALSSIKPEPAPEQTLLEFTSKGGFQFLYDRAWHVVNETNEAATLRLVDRGELIAQCNASALAKVEAGKLASRWHAFKRTCRSRSAIISSSSSRLARRKTRLGRRPAVSSPAARSSRSRSNGTTISWPTTRGIRPCWPSRSSRSCSNDLAIATSRSWRRCVSSRPQVDTAASRRPPLRAGSRSLSRMRGGLSGRDRRAAARRGYNRPGRWPHAATRRTDRIGRGLDTHSANRACAPGRGVAKAWGDSSLAALQPHEEVIQAIRHHDDGWSDWDAAPDVDPAIGRPRSFVEMSLDESIDIWRRSIFLACSRGYLAAHMVSNHFTTLLQNASPRWSLDPARFQASRQFLDEQSDYREQWLARWQASNPAIRTRKMAERALAYLQFFDGLSLWFCGTARGEPQSFATPEGYEVSLIPLGPRQFTCAPGH